MALKQEMSRKAKEPAMAQKAKAKNKWFYTVNGDGGMPALLPGRAPVPLTAAKRQKCRRSKCWCMIAMQWLRNGRSLTFLLVEWLLVIELCLKWRRQPYGESTTQLPDSCSGWKHSSYSIVQEAYRSCRSVSGHEGASHCRPPPHPQENNGISQHVYKRMNSVLDESQYIWARWFCCIYSLLAFRKHSVVE